MEVFVKNRSEEALPKKIVYTCRFEEYWCNRC